MASCEKCWEDARGDAGKYHELIKEREDDPCTPEEQNEQCTIPVVVRSAFTDDEIRDMMDGWFEHYKNVGDSHHQDTPDFRIIEVYWDKVIDRVLDDLGIELNDKQIDDFCDWLADFY